MLRHLSGALVQPAVADRQTNYLFLESALDRVDQVGTLDVQTTNGSLLKFQQEVVAGVSSPVVRSGLQSTEEALEEEMTSIIALAETRQSHAGMRFADEDVNAISLVLRQMDKSEWSELPRTYTILRMI